MRNIILVVGLIVVTVVIWLGLLGKMSALENSRKKTLDKPVPISDTMDTEYLELIQ